MARAIWSGSIGFGMVSIPMKLFGATESKDISFHLLHATCGTRLKQVRWCPTDEREVPWNETMRGYEYAKDQYVTLTDEDFEKLPLASTHTIELSAFVKGLTAIATITIRKKEQLCALRPKDGALMLETLYYPDEIRAQPEMDLSKTKITERELEMAFSLIDLLRKPFDPTEYTDHYREALSQLIEAKLEGREVVTSPAAREAKIIDLADALRRSVEAAKKGKPKRAARPRTRPAARRDTRKVS